MTAIVLSSNEKDQTKINFAINQLAQGRSNATMASYTATLIPNTGTITQGGDASFFRFGTIVFVAIAVTVIAVTGAPASFDITLPVASKRDININGEEVAVTGLVLHFLVGAGATASATKVRDTTAAFRAPTVGDKYAFSFFYESA